MCFTNNLNQTAPKVAENDIECYKFLMDLCSPFYYNGIWKENELKEAEIAETADHNDELNIGFHSCKDVERCIWYRADVEYQHICPIYKFIIPKGALYYENNNEYLSDKIYLASEKPVEPKVEIKYEVIA